MSFNPSFRLAFAAVLLLSIDPCTAMLDQDGDGMSDLWQQMHAGAVAGQDSDGDGFSAEDEAVAGTDPADRASRLALTGFGLVPGGGEAYFRWAGISGKAYVVEQWNPATHVWSAAGNLYVANAGPQELEVPSPGSSGIFRLRVTDRDADGDGLAAWEEKLLGLSDASARSSAQVGRADYAAAFRMLEGSGNLTLPGGQIIPKRPTSRAEAARFLVQASFGADGTLIDQVAAQGIGGWLNAQFTAPVTSTYNMMQVNGQPYNVTWWRQGWWRSIMLGEDQLRQRVAFALSQIFVINCEAGSILGDNPLTQGRYYDMLANGGFGGFRPLLENVSYSAQMGYYLSHLKNRKSAPALNRFPDENFARELMQLFSIGLWELNPDGSRKLDEEGNFIPTYDNTGITEMAKVFTGLGFGLNSGFPNNSFFTGGAGNDYQAPMKMFDDEHEPGEKHIVSDVTIPAGQTGNEDIADALDALCNHPNVGPFIGRLLIQRFTCSNPSPEYLTRVSGVWADDGSGQRGNLKAVMEAILLDPEARTPEASGDASGKVREPVLRLTGLLRAFKARNAGNTFPPNGGYMMEPMGQFPLLSPSVFNFYSPDHRPAGEMRNRGLVSPELEIATTSRLLLTDNLFRSAVDFGYQGISLDYSQAVAHAANNEDLMDFLDGLLTWGRMSASTRARVKSVVDIQLSNEEKVTKAVLLIIESPDYVVLK